MIVIGIVFVFWRFLIIFVFLEVIVFFWFMSLVEWVNFLYVRDFFIVMGILSKGLFNNMDFFLYVFVLYELRILLMCLVFFRVFLNWLLIMVFSKGLILWILLMKVWIIFWYFNLCFFIDCIILYVDNFKIGFDGLWIVILCFL